MEQLRSAYISRLRIVARTLQYALEKVHDDPEEVRALCHRLRGSAGAYALPRLSELAAQAEEAPAEELVSSVQRLLRYLDGLSHGASAPNPPTDRP